MTAPLTGRVAAAVLFGLVAGVIAWNAEVRLGAAGGDHFTLWRGAHDVLAGIDPYHLTSDGGPPAVNVRFPYPLPAVLLALPFAWLSVSHAAMAFATVSGAALGFAITRDGFARVPIVGSTCFLAAAQLGQLSTAVLAVALLPWVGCLVIAKPNLGLALVAWRPSWRIVLGGTGLVFASLVAAPLWPLHWLTSIHHSPAHRAPVLVGLGASGLLAIFRWRRPEARLLIAMTLIPHGLYFYDELPLWLIAETTREAVVLTAVSWVALLAWLAFTTMSAPAASPFVTLLYPVAAAIVLRRPNVATDRRLA